MVAEAECMVCKSPESTEVWPHEVAMWVKGDSAQVVWPGKSPQEREIVMQSQYARLLDRPFPGPCYICGICDSKFNSDVCDTCGGLGECADGDCEEV